MKFAEYIFITLALILTGCSTPQNSVVEKAADSRMPNACILPDKNISSYIDNDRLLAAIEVADLKFKGAVDHPCEYLYRRVVSKSKDYFIIHYFPESQDPNYDIAGGDIKIFIDKKSLQFVKGLAGQ